MSVPSGRGRPPLRASVRAPRTQALAGSRPPLLVDDLAEMLCVDLRGPVPAIAPGFRQRLTELCCEFRDRVVDAGAGVPHLDEAHGARLGDGEDGRGDVELVGI